MTKYSTNKLGGLQKVVRKAIDEFDRILETEKNSSLRLMAIVKTIDKLEKELNKSKYGTKTTI